MRRVATSLFILMALSAVAADDFPLTLRVLGTSERTREHKRLMKDPCIKSGMGAPCSSYEQMPGPGWPIDILQITGRVTQRGRTTEYLLECRAASGKTPCTSMKSGEYPARWNGKRLEVLVRDANGRQTVNRFEIKGEHDSDNN